MPLTAIVTAPIFAADLTANSIAGIGTSQLSLALATGLETYAGSGLRAQSVDVGTLGVGTGSGLGLFITPAVLLAAFTASFTSNGILGPKSAAVLTAFSTSFSTVLAQAVITTANPSVGVGTGTVLAIPNSLSSLAAFQAGFSGAGVNGSMAAKMSAAVSQGLDQALPSGVGFIVIAGSPSPTPSSGSGTGTFV